MATNEEVQKKARDIAKLREKIAEEETKVSTRIADASNDVAMIQLEQEEQRLENQLNTVRANSAATTKTAIKQQVRSITDGPEAVDLDAQSAAAEKE